MALSEGRESRLRDGLLALGFLLLVGAAVWTVALPELTKEPDGGKKAPAPPPAAVGPAPTD